MVESRDSDTGEHVQKTAAYVKIIVEGLKKKGYYAEKITPKFISDVVRSAPLHDVGKINISDRILNKPGKLTDEEFEIMKTHTVKGCEILNKMPGDWDKTYMRISMEICRHHHEKYDGKGYPDRLAGDMIPISAQIVSVADCYDALVSKRVYKDAYSCEQAFDMIYNGECGVFSPKLMDSFTRCKDQFELQVKMTQNG